jgi:hypothetical protein
VQRFSSIKMPSVTANSVVMKNAPATGIGPDDLTEQLMAQG